jgi:LmbE family N-acetylglucosaminyl deacetylase
MKVRQALAAMRRLPVADLTTIAGGIVLVLAPHADDESLGCGGLIAEACRQGTPPGVLVLTDGAASHPGSIAYPPGRLKQIRAAEARQAVARLGLGLDRIGFLALPDAAAPQHGPAFARAVAAIVARARALRAAAIVAPWRHDPHCDHLAAHLMAREAASRLGIRHLAYPLWGWLLPPESEISGRVSGFRLPIGRHLPAKRHAIAAHRSQRGRVVMDSPSGFTLPAALLAVCNRPYEVILTTP